MAVHRLKSSTPPPDEWRVAKKIKPNQRGAIKLTRVHGNELLCVRYRENSDGTERLTTIELVVERAMIQKRSDPVVSLKLAHDEIDLRRKLISRGATYNAKTGLWRLGHSQVLLLGLGSRIVAPRARVKQEHVHA